MNIKEIRTNINIIKYWHKCTIISNDSIIVEKNEELSTKDKKENKLKRIMSLSLLVRRNMKCWSVRNATHLSVVRAAIV